MFWWRKFTLAILQQSVQTFCPKFVWNEIKCPKIKSQKYNVWNFDLQNFWQVKFYTVFASEKYNFFDMSSNHNSILTLWLALNHPSSPVSSFQQFHSGRPDPQGLHHGQQSKFDYKETKDFKSITWLLQWVNTWLPLISSFLCKSHNSRTIKSNTLISEHVVPHQRSDWGDNINSSQMGSDSYYPKTNVLWQKCKTNSLYLLGLFCFWFRDFLVCLGRILLYNEHNRKSVLHWFLQCADSDWL